MVDKDGTNSEEAQFDPGMFIIPASDTKGHSRRAQFRTQPGHINMAESIVSSKKFPFKTKGDLYRFALSLALKWLEKQKPVPSTTAQVDAIMEVMRNEQFSKELRDTIEKLSGQIADLIGNNAEGEASRLVHKVRRLVGDMPEGYWRDRYIKEMSDRFGYMMNKTKRASLTQLNQE
jgi:hypothetical protein